MATASPTTTHAGRPVTTAAASNTAYPTTTPTRHALPAMGPVSQRPCRATMRNVPHRSPTAVGETPDRSHAKRTLTVTYPFGYEWCMSTWEALVDPTRRAIVTRLAAGDLPAGEIVDGFAISRPGVSRHLRVLREAGLVAAHRDGTRQIYSLDRAATAEVEEWAAQVRRSWEQRLDSLDTEITRGKRARRTKGNPS